MKLFKFLSLQLFVALIALNLSAQIPTGYYDGTDGLTSTALQSKLHQIIDNHNSVSYSYIWTAVKTTDRRSDGKVWDMYSDCDFTFGSDQCGNYSSECDCYNREHSWPKSWFNDNSPMNTDIHHIVPTDGKVNGMRSNYPFGEVGSATYTSSNGSKLGNCNYPGYTGTVFEPIDEYKGDFARIYFYMATRYYGEDGSWQSNAMVDGAKLKPWALDMMLEWHHNDPVSTKEITRNDGIYDIQHNRNPFIDHPEFADLIWDPTASQQDLDYEFEIDVYPVPVASKLHISFTQAEKFQGYSLCIYDLTGKMVIEPKNVQGEEFDVNTQHLKPGMYIMSLLNEQSKPVYRCKITK